MLLPLVATEPNEMGGEIRWVGFDGDDTLWRSEDYYRQAEQDFERILGGYIDLADSRTQQHLLAVERRNLKIFGYGVKGMTLSMLESAIELTEERISARDLHLDDDRGRPIYTGVELHVPQGGVLALHGAGPIGKSALLYTLAGRVPAVKGDLKVLGHVLPQHAHALRPEVEVVDCRRTPDLEPRIAAALGDDVRLVLLDDVDLVLRTGTRDALRNWIAARRNGSGEPVAFVVTCQDPERIQDLLPADALWLAPATPPVEVAR